MKFFAVASLLSAVLLVSARADLTIVEKIEGGNHGGDMTIKIKGDKSRIEFSPQATIIMDSKTGDFVNLINTEKKFIRMSADQIKAMAEMAAKFNPNKQSNDKPKLAPTGKKEMINGYEAEEYSYDTPLVKGSCWIASSYPDGAAIMKQLQAIKPEAWKNASTGMLDYRDFPGFPIKSQFSMGGRQVTTTVVSVKKDNLSDAEFVVPPDFEEVKMPEMLMGNPPAQPAVPAPPKP